MKTKNKLTTIIASLILVFGLSYAPTTNINEARAGSDICSHYEPAQKRCDTPPINCFCEIIITPGN